jgi:hypothetical protein
MNLLVHTICLFLIQGIYFTVYNPSIFLNLFSKLTSILLIYQIFNFGIPEIHFLFDIQYATNFLFLIYYFISTKPIVFVMFWIFSFQLSLSIILSRKKFNFQNNQESLNTLLFLLPSYFCFCLRWFVNDQMDRKKISEMGLDYFQVFEPIFWTCILVFVQVILYTEIFKLFGIRKNRNSFFLWSSKFKHFFEEQFEFQYDFISGYWNLLFPGDYTSIFMTILTFSYHLLCCILSISIIWNFNHHLTFFVFVHLVLIYNTLF